MMIDVWLACGLFADSSRSDCHDWNQEVVEMGLRQAGGVQINLFEEQL